MGLTFCENSTSGFKCSIQKSGHLGFSRACIQILGLDKLKAIFFAKDDDDNLCLVTKADAGDKYSYRVYQSNQYPFVKAQRLFDRLGFKYKEKTIIFDLSSHPKYPNTYIMTPRYIERRKR